jgi:predicted Fe-S protein YdhL (DUF1289 family)
MGCGRHVDEIAAWTLMSVAEQWAVLARSAERRNRRMISVQEVKDYGRER